MRVYNLLRVFTRWKKYASLYRMTHYVLFIPIFSIGLQLVFLPSSTRGVLLPSSPLRHWRSRNTLRFFGYANRAKLKPVMGKFNKNKNQRRSAKANGLTTQSDKKNVLLKSKSGDQNPLKKNGANSEKPKE